MKTTIKGLFTLTLATFAGMCISSCSAEKDYYDPSVVEAQKKAEYAANFVSKYGKVAADQSWDFSTLASSYRTTRAEGDITPVIDDEWYNVEKGTLDYMLNELKEGVNNRAKGAPFIMSAPNNGFAIYPIYQGGAAFKWDLHMVVEQSGTQIADINVWQKHRDLESQLSEQQIEQDLNPLNRDGNKCTPFAEQFGYSRNTTDWYDTHHTFSLEPGGWWQDYEYGWNTMAASAIRTKGIHFPTLPVGANIFFYLDVKSEKDGNWVDKKKESSLAHMMVALNCETPTNLPNHEITIIGCEDNSDGDSDWDMNDLVFMVVGDPIVPKPIEIKEDQYDEIISKRYMVEDLGSTDDFDFNDIVVDVEEIRTHEIELVNGAKVKDEVVSTKQQAIVRAMGGTIDFELYIGDTNTPWIKSVDSEYSVSTMVNTTNINFNQELAKFDVTGWDPAANNIRVVVKGNASTGTQPRSIDFPKAGEIPMIIAYDTNVNWQEERSSLPKSWE